MMMEKEKSIIFWNGAVEIDIIKAKQKLSCDNISIMTKGWRVI